MKIVVVGATGMLGKRVVKEAEKRGHEVLFLLDRLGEDFYGFHYRGVPIENFDVVINCSGKISLRDSYPEEMIRVNSLGPWQLSERLEGMRLIHMSTDCVFSGKTANFKRHNTLPDPADLYGRSKLAGEPEGKNILVVRGSFIGPDHGFFKWVVEGSGSIEAWQGAKWNGGSVGEMARILIHLAERDTEGIVHVGAEKVVTKAWMIQYLISALGLQYDIKIVDYPEIYRFLEPNVILQPVMDSLDELIAEME